MGDSDRDRGDPRAEPALLRHIGDETLKWAGWADDEDAERHANRLGLAIGAGMVLIIAAQTVSFCLALLEGAAAVSFAETVLTIGMVFAGAFFAVPAMRKRWRALKRPEKAIWAVTDRRLLQVICGPHDSAAYAREWRPDQIEKVYQRNLDGTPELIVIARRQRGRPRRSYLLGGIPLPVSLPGRSDFLVITSTGDLDAAERALRDLPIPGQTPSGDSLFPISGT